MFITARFTNGKIKCSVSNLINKRCNLYIQLFIDLWSWVGLLNCSYLNCKIGLKRHLNPDLWPFIQSKTLHFPSGFRSLLYLRASWDKERWWLLIAIIINESVKTGMTPQLSQNQLTSLAPLNWNAEACVFPIAIENVAVIWACLRNIENRF